MQPLPCYLTAQQNLMDAFPVLIKSEMRNIPVVNDEKEMKLIGSVLRSEALGIIRRRLNPADTLQNKFAIYTSRIF
jgi:CBS-domain-containing membrane protein